jgi:hypothetical protein
VVSGGPTSLPGLYFCGFNLASTGMLREIGTEARRISREIRRCTRNALPTVTRAAAGR